MRGISLMGILVLIFVFWAGMKWGAPVFSKIGLA